MKKLLFDIESTGLLRCGSQLHCIVLRDLSDESADPLVFDSVKGNFDEGIEVLENAELLSGHNICGYDIPLLKELYPSFAPKAELHDTLILSRLFYPHITERDYEQRVFGMPKKLYGSHGLEAWGHRLRCHKGDFGKQNDWSTYTREMLEYCILDCELNVRLYQFLSKQINAT